jgi:hypothetical protein
MAVVANALIMLGRSNDDVLQNNDISSLNWSQETEDDSAVNAESVASIHRRNSF